MVETHGNCSDVIIVGGGTGGITVAARLAKKKIFSSITIIEPSSTHYYQPIWTLVGGGIVPKEISERREADVIPQGVDWVHDAVTSFQPEHNSLVTQTGQKWTYKYLVVSPGMEIFWDRIQGLKENLGRNGVCSNYSYETVDSTWREIHNFKGGRAVFTFPNTPIKCGGAPQKIMYLAEDYFRRMHIRNECEVIFASAGAQIFGVKKYAEKLASIVQKRDIHTLFKNNLVAIDGQKHEAHFKNVETQQETVLKYDMIHVTPPMGAPAFIRNSPLADKEGWISVDKFSLQHTSYPNIFGLGDASSLPTSRTGAAIRKQAPTLVDNLINLSQGKPLSAKYNGYTSCPLVTRYGKVILAEFDYDGNPCESFPFDQSKERTSMYILKKHFLPAMYWEGMLKGRL